MVLLILAAFVALMPALSQEKVAGAKPVLYVIGTAHLDSQWNWTVQDTIRQYLGVTVSRMRWPVMQATGGRAASRRAPRL
jgi:hypothetical protein